MSQSKENEWLTLSDVAKLLGVSQGTVRRWADSGRLPFFRTPGGHRRFLSKEVARFISRGHQAGEQSLLHMENQVLSVVRSDISTRIGEQSWYRYYDSDRSDRRRDTGRRLVGLLMHYTSQTANSDLYLQEAKELMRGYGFEAKSLNMNLYDTAQAYLFFRRSLNEAVVASAQVDDIHSPHLLVRMNRFWDELLLALIEGYTGSESSASA